MIPHFTSTNHAEEFGRHMTYSDYQKCHALITTHTCYAYMCEGQKRLDHAAQAQFAREAQDAYTRALPEASPELLAHSQ